MTEPAQPIQTQDPMVAAFSARASQAAPATAAQDTSIQGGQDPMLAAFQQRQQAKAVKQPEQQQEKPYNPAEHGALNRFGHAFAEPFVSVFHGLADEPQDANEIGAHAGGGQAGVIAYRAAKQLVAAHDAMMKASPGDSFRKAAFDFQKAALDYGLGDKRSALMHGVSGATDVAEGTGAPVPAKARQLSEGAAKGGDLATPLGGVAADVAIGAAGAGFGKVVAGLGETGGEAAEVAESAPKGPSLVKQIVKGKSVAQEPAKAAVREISGAEEETPLLEGHKTAIDEKLMQFQKEKQLAYKTQDEAAGFDVKQTKETLRDAEDKIKQPEISPATKKRLQSVIDESKKSLADAEGKFKEAGIDPKAADVANAKWRAAQDLRKGIVQHTSADGESVNVDGLLNYAKKMRNTKYGDRLEQIAGKEGADSFMKKLQDAHDLGVHAVKMRWIAGAIGTGIGVTGEAARVIKGLASSGQ